MSPTAPDPVETIEKALALADELRAIVDQLVASGHGTVHGSCQQNGCQWPQGLALMILEHKRYRDALRRIADDDVDGVGDHADCVQSFAPCRTQSGAGTNEGATMTKHWIVSPWIAKRPEWGVEVRRRPQLRHSQIRLALGRRRYTLMNVARGKAQEQTKGKR